jgi:hypothetical protein
MPCRVPLRMNAAVFTDCALSHGLPMREALSCDPWRSRRCFPEADLVELRGQIGPIDWFVRKNRKKKMSLFGWLAIRPLKSRSSCVKISGSRTGESTGPSGSLGSRPTHHSAGQTDGAPGRKSERQVHREQLYGVVRSAMLKAGVLQSSYKFKVLSLDSSGRQFLVMMEMSWLHSDEAHRLVEIENSIAQQARNQHGILVSAVYWRMNEYVSAGPHRALCAQGGPARPVAPTTPPKGVGFPPLKAEEVAAFKRAIASVAKPQALSAPGQIIHSGRHNPTPEIRFGPTDVNDRPSPLSATQYGDLN